mmetsp:Transcript_14793/g.22408  ORF Transcript_14793/g.22408 Transcript_14793/m.22408 type:complete len:560 (-) Transcript_14793:46-1725(-)
MNLADCSALSWECILNHFLATTAAAATLVVVFYSTGRTKKRETSTKEQQQQHEYEYPPYAPVGIVKTLIELSGSRTPWFFLKMARKTSSDVFRLPLPIPGGLYIVCNPEVGRTILTDETTDKAEGMYKGFNTVIGGPTVFTRSNHGRISGPKWKAVRRGTAHAFASSQVSRMNHICAKHVDHWITENIQKAEADAQVQAEESKQQQQQHVSFQFDPSEEMTRLTFKALAESAFEYHVTDEEYDFFTHHVQTASKEFVVRRQRIIRKLYAFLDPSYWEAVRSCKKFQTFGQRVLDAYRTNPNKSSHNTLIKLIEENTSLKTDWEKVAEINVWMLAGYDTTGYTLANAVVLLAKHPRVATKLQQELSSVENPNERSKSKYLRCVISEVQRILPITASGSARVTGRDFEFFDRNDSGNCGIGGIDGIISNSSNGSASSSNENIKVRARVMCIPCGSNVVVPFLVSHRFPSIFKEPDDFYPERWDTPNDNDNNDKAKAMKAALTPFSVGMRNCPGQSLAMTEMLTALTRLMADFELEVQTEGSFQVMRFIGFRLRATRVTKQC